MELGERLRCATGSSELPHGPGLPGARVHRSPAKAVAWAGAGAGVRAGDDTPTAAVPLLGQRPAAAVSHSPHIAGRERRDAEEVVECPVGAGAGNDAPRGAVPVQSERLKSTAGISERAHGPDVVGGDSGDSKQEVGLRAGARTS